MGGWKTRVYVDEGQMGLEEAGLWAGLSVLWEEGWQVVVFWEVDWLDFCAEVE